MGLLLLAVDTALMIKFIKALLYRGILLNFSYIILILDCIFALKLYFGTAANAILCKFKKSHNIFGWKVYVNSDEKSFLEW